MPVIKRKQPIYTDTTAPTNQHDNIPLLLGTKNATARHAGH